jgi:hypothetical protein
MFIFADAAQKKEKKLMLPTGVSKSTAHTGMGCRLRNTSGQQRCLLFFFFLGSTGRNEQQIKLAHWRFKIYRPYSIYSIKHGLQRHLDER